MAEATPARIRDGAIEWSNTAVQRGGLRGGVNKQCAQCMLDKESGAPTQAGNGAGHTRRHSHTLFIIYCRSLGSRERWNRTTETVESPTDLKSAHHTSEAQSRLFN